MEPRRIRRVLYRLPDVLEALASEKAVFVVEGEKDADALWRLGIPATCNAGGANKWRPEYGEALRGADIVVIGDNDQAGRDHVQSVAAALHCTARRVRVLDLVTVWPDCPPKGDVSKWLAAGGTAATSWSRA
jgi:DNA primase